MHEKIARNPIFLNMRSMAAWTNDCNDNNKNRVEHGVSSFMLGALVSSSENPQALAVGVSMALLMIGRGIYSPVF